MNAKDDPFFALGGRFLYGSLGFESIKGFFDPAKGRLELGLHIGIKGINFEVDLFGRGWFGWWRRAKVFRNITQPLSAPENDFWLPSVRGPPRWGPPAHDHPGRRWAECHTGVS